MPRYTRIVISRLRWDSHTQAHIKRRSGEGRSRREVIRCLKRYVAREIFTLITDTASAGRPLEGQPLAAWHLLGAINTEEFLAAELRTGRAGSNTATDHVEVSAPIPAAHRRHLLVLCDGAGTSQRLVKWVEQGQVWGRSL